MAEIRRNPNTDFSGVTAFRVSELISSTITCLENYYTNVTSFISIAIIRKTEKKIRRYK